MESADLRVFQAVAREGSITKAASRLGYVQSNVTARIRQLESELGTELFFRHNRGMTLSPSGKTLLAYADKIVGLMDEAVKALTSTDDPAGRLLIGSTQSAAAVRMPKLLAAYYNRYPNVQLSLTAGHSDFLTEKVLQYELDGAFIGNKSNHPELQSVPAFEEELVIVSAPPVTSLEEAVTKPILVFSSGCTYRDVLKRWLPTVGWTQSVVMEFGTLEAIIGGVAAGLGISLLPRSVVGKHEADGAIRVHAVPDTIRHMPTTFITRKDSFASSALRAFIATFSAAGEPLETV
ncbi:LysR family transcriptional regulator [Gordoniibacillus kamchatkensis]|uniref:LysR family transcriptional regulator n=1 Tax=Gordoniibacillus kamchatkensis TaxID=1590651 RepID=A0ABR5AEC8_9BACL|nr:LysR family transcriptional regulator [Paenibacillus sp. VKM B-2647]KIL39321.1 LysR family transcriptional regulator [Paenibacillus sp. VKM B-2647]